MPRNQEPKVKLIVRTGEGLRDALFDVFDGLRDGTLTANKAIAAAKVACQIINTVKVEIEYQTYVSMIRRNGGEDPGVGTLRLGGPINAK